MSENYFIDPDQIRLVTAWGEQKGILSSSDALSQCLKTGSELGELCDAVLKGTRHEQIDAIGDVLVTLVMVRELSGLSADSTHYRWFGHPVNTIRDSKRIVAKLLHLTGLLAETLAERDPAKGTVHEYTCIIVGWLRALADEMCLPDLNTSLTLSYGVITHRKGEMVNGAFVKES